MTPETVSVVICCFTLQRWDDLRDAVESVHQQTLAPCEVIVVVDHNAELLARAEQELTGVRVLASRGERGLSAARNTGAGVAVGSLVAFLDDDARAAPDWLAWLTVPYRNTGTFAVGGSVDPWWVDGKPDWYPDEFGWVVGCSYRGLPTATAPVRNPIGANMSFRREVFGDVGGFRSGIGRVGDRPFGCEETELCIRARQHYGTGVAVYEPRAHVSHRVPAPRAQWRYFRARCFAEGLSKAAVSGLVGRQSALSAERSYALSVLPRALASNLGDFVRGDRSGAARAGAVLVGLTLTIFGYAAGVTRRAGVCGGAGRHRR
jgi:glucosyl-dolichyl phosphate glucuronosyltransferase